MRVLVFHVTIRRSGARARKGEVLEVERLTIGRGTDNALQVPGLTVALHHSVIVKRPNGIHLEAVDARDLRVNGLVTAVQRLEAGDVVRIGQRELRVLDTESTTEDLIVEIREVPTARDGSLAARTRLGVERGLFARRPLSWALVGLIFGAALVPPLLQRARPRDEGALSAAARWVETGWSAGPLARRHAHLGGDCRACHARSFVPVRDDECIACHSAMGRHAAAEAPLADLDAIRCASCHVEHEGAERLADADPGRCGSCHSALDRRFPQTTLLDVADFGRRHPELRPSVVVDPAAGVRRRIPLDEARDAERSGLDFSHAAHLAQGLAGAEGEPVDLSCADCHELEATAAVPEPISFERHCRSCHELALEPRSERTVPHADAEHVRRAVREAYAELALGGGSPPASRRREPPVPADRPGALTWAKERAEAAERRLFADGGTCDLCHELAGTGVAAAIVPVVLPPHGRAGRWFPLATFTHRPHRSTPCTSCHHVAEADRASAIAMPGIARCRACHGDSGAIGEVPSTCVTCHAFHHPERGVIGVAEVAPIATHGPAPPSATEAVRAASPTAAPPPEPTLEPTVTAAAPMPPAFREGLVGEGVEIRTRPDETAPILGDFEGRATVEVIEVRDGWSRVRAPVLPSGSIVGWVRSDAVSPAPR